MQLNTQNSILAVNLVDSFGRGLYLAGSAVFFSMVIGLSVTEIGFGLSLGACLAFFAQPVIGRLADLAGPKRVLIALYLLRGLAFAGLAFATDFYGFLAAACLISVSQYSLQPLYQGLIGKSFSAEQRVTLMASVRIINNIGYSLGGLVVAAALGFDLNQIIAWFMLGSTFCSVVAAFVLHKVIAADELATRPAAGSKSALSIEAVRDVPYMAVAAINGFLCLHSAMLTVGLPLWVMLHTSAPKFLVGVLLTVNTVCTIAFQLRAARGSETKAGGSSALQRAALVLAACCCCIGVAAHIGDPILASVFLIAGVVLLTVGEVLHSAGSWGLSFLLAPEVRRNEYLATFNLGIVGQYILGPALMTGFVIAAGPMGWLALAVAFLAAGAMVTSLVERAASRAVPSAKPAAAGLAPA